MGEVDQNAASAHLHLGKGAVAVPEMLALAGKRPLEGARAAPGVGVHGRFERAGEGVGFRAGLANRRSAPNQEQGAAEQASDAGEAEEAFPGTGHG